MQTQKEHVKLNGILLVILALFFSTQANSQWKQPVALQPFGTIDHQLLQQVVNGIKKMDSSPRRCLRYEIIKELEESLTKELKGLLRK